MNVHVNGQLRGHLSVLACRRSPFTSTHRALLATCHTFPHPPELMTVDQFVFLAVTMGGGRVRSFNTGWKKFSPQTRNDRITQCDSVYLVYRKAPTRQSHSIRIAVWKWPHWKTNQLIRCCHPHARKSAAQAVLSRMQLTRRTTRQTPHGPSRLVQAMSAWSVKTRTCSVPAL